MSDLALIVVLLAAAVAAVTFFRRLRLPQMVAYLLVGLAAGPFGFGWIDDMDRIRHLAEFGVVFLLFSLGLEFSIPQLMSLRRIVFGAGPAQVLVTAALVTLVMHLAGFRLATSVVAGGALALSSTAIVIRELITRGELNTSYGRSATGILLFQDLAAVVMLVLLPSLTQADGNAWIATVETLFKTLILFGGMYMVGKWVLPRLLEETGRTRSDEVFVMVALLLALLAAWVTHALGLSMALGAFLAGLMLGESHFRHQIESDIRPFRDLLLGLFFISVGMLVDPALFLDYWHWIIPGALLLLIFKALLTASLLKLLGERTDTALRTGIVLAQGGEFGFVLVTLAVSLEVFSPDRAGMVVAITILTMAATPTLVQNSARVARRIQERMEAEPEESEPVSEETRDHVILCGYGRVGQNLSRYLNRFRIDSVAIDDDMVRVQEATHAGEKVFFGDASRKEILEKAGLHRASLLVITFDDARRAEQIIHLARSLEPDLRVLVRTRDDARLEALQQAGATEVVPEVLEASLMLIAHALLLLDVPFGRVLAMLRQSRRGRYRLLQGYYPGESLPVMDGDTPYRVLHAVTLAGQARCQGRRIGETGLDRVNARVRAVRRLDRNIQDPDDDFLLEEGDVVILYGSRDAVEAGEELLLGG